MNITITGPRSVGKTTISKKLAKKMKMKRISSDEIGNKALEKEGGLDKATKSGKIEKIIQNSGYSLIKRFTTKKRILFLIYLAVQLVLSNSPRLAKKLEMLLNLIH